MNQLPSRPETFEEFKDSFAYGSRTDLAFKFLKRLSPEEAAAFLAALLGKLGETIDDGDADRLIQHAYEWQVRAYAAAERRFAYDDGPLTPLQAPLRQCRVALLTSSGHFVAGDDPRPFGVERMTQEQAIARIEEFLREAPRLSVIPSQTALCDLRVRHGGYDIRAAEQDPNVVFPLDRLRELVAEGVIGGARASGLLLRRRRGAGPAEAGDGPRLGGDAASGGGRCRRAGACLTGLPRVRGARRASLRSGRSGHGGDLHPCLSARSRSHARPAR